MTRNPAVVGNPILGRGDLVKAIASGQPEILNAMLVQLGLTRQPPKPEPMVLRGSPQSASVAARSVPEMDSSGYPSDIDSIALWMQTRYAALAPLEELPPGKAYLKWQLAPDATKPEYKLLAPWKVIGPRLRRGLVDLKHAKQPDVPVLTALIAEGEFVAEIPRRRRRRWGQSVQIVNDLSLRLTPFQYDQHRIIEHLRHILSSDGLEVAEGFSPYHLSLRSAKEETDHQDAWEYRIPQPNTHVLVLSDLGCLAESDDLRNLWLRWGRMLRRQGCRLTALVPCNEQQIARQLRDSFSIQNWQRGPIASILDPESRHDLVKRLLVLAAPSLRLEPGLLRDLRLLLPEAGDASLEAAVWNSPRLFSNHPIAATIDPRVANEELRPEFEKLPQELRRNVLKCIRNWRINIQGAPEIWFEELLCLSEDSRQLVPPQDLIDARASVRELDQRRKTGGADADAVEAWLYGATQRLTESALADEDVGRILRETKRALHPEGRKVATGTDPREIPGDTLQRHAIRIDDLAMTISTEPTTDARQDGAPAIAQIDATNLYFEVAVPAPPSAKSFWKTGKPDFASAFGTDKYGAWFEFAVPRRDGNGVVTQRMRWIRAGTFLMGSPETELERATDETLHEVKLSHGFWLAESACAQELWEAVTSSTPSRFKGQDHPVEQVSYTDVVQFCEQLSKLIPGLMPALPTEAQWEYACRAGTTTPFSFGDTITTDQANFNGNYPYAGSAKGEYRQKTVSVKSQPANRWGLYQMHGNVWEWCRDWHAEYSTATQVDPVGPKTGSDRVLRGGGWFFHARGVRSACRYGFGPGHRHDFLGFRLLSSAGSAEPTEAAEVPVAEQGSEQIRFGVADEKFCGKTIRLDDDVPTRLELASPSVVRVRSNLEEIHLHRLIKPPWAVAFGRDLFGMYADFEVPAHQDSNPVRQRMRWIPPGQFLMGSPRDETGRYENEVQHHVTLSTGFWMFDTPCTQRLWMAVMEGDNPSRFSDPLRPMEQVEWKQATEFATKLAAKIPELCFRLPTEAQWEYACRAGTSTPIYSGSLEILGDANAPALDPIAWYGGNSGHEFDREDGVDITSYLWLSSKQYEFSVAGTRPVKQKRPNPWGLYDMLGNVWEWCQDWHSDYSLEPQVDPMGPEDGSNRVVRGGSWIYNARYVRSACRHGNDPGNRYYVLGFRLLSSSGPVKSELPNK